MNGGERLTDLFDLMPSVQAVFSALEYGSQLDADKAKKALEDHLEECRTRLQELHVPNLAVLEAELAALQPQAEDKEKDAQEEQQQQS